MLAQMGCHVYDTTKQYALSDEDIHGVQKEIGRRSSQEHIQEQCHLLPGDPGMCTQSQ